MRVGQFGCFEVIHVVSPEVDTHLKVMPVLGYGEIIYDLPLVHIPPLREKDAEGEKTTYRSKTRHAAVGRAKDLRKCGVGLVYVHRLKDRRVRQIRENAVVDYGRVKDVRPVQLALILPL